MAALRTELLPVVDLRTAFRTNACVGRRGQAAEPEQQFPPGPPSPLPAPGTPRGEEQKRLTTKQDGENNETIVNMPMTF